MFLLMVLALMSTISQADVVACSKMDATSMGQMSFAGTCGTFAELKAQMTKDDASAPDITEGVCDFGTSGVCAMTTAMQGMKLPTLPTGCTFGGMKTNAPALTEAICTSMSGTYTSGTANTATSAPVAAAATDAPVAAAATDAPVAAAATDAPVTSAPVPAAVSKAPVAAAVSKAPVAAADSKAPVAAAAVSKAPVAAAAVTTAKPVTAAVGSFALIGLAVLAFLKF